MPRCPMNSKTPRLRIFTVSIAEIRATGQYLIWQCHYVPVKRRAERLDTNAALAFFILGIGPR